MRPDGHHFLFVMASAIIAGGLVSLVADRTGVVEVGAILVGLAAHLLYVHRQDVRAARLADLTRCPHCLHSRNGLDPDARCPECGCFHPGYHRPVT